MNDILRKTFDDHGFDTRELPGNILLSAIDNQEYYLIVQYSEEELIEFFELKKTNEIIKQFEELQSEIDDIKKNTTLFIYVETNNIEEFHKDFRNNIFKIEEDEYFFRKHVIIFSKESIKNINEKHEISKEIHRILLKDDGIDKFEKEYCKDEEFYLAVQLMAKIPFLVFKHSYEDYESLQEKVKKEPAIADMVKFIQRFDAEDSSDYFDSLEMEILSEEDTPKLDAVFKQVEEINI